MIEPSTALAFSLFENKGIYALLLGSGVSRGAQIATGWEITLDLIRRVAAFQSVTCETDWAGWYRRQTGREPSYSEVLDDPTTVPDERRSILHSYIEPTADDIAEGRRVPTKAHHAIAWLVREGFIRVIVTTNFDRLLENALRAAGVEPTVIRSDDDLRGAVPLIHSRCFLLKVHGDYLDSRIRNTDQELSAYSSTMDALMDRILDDHGLIVCGWSGDWDHALRAAITRTPNRRFPTFWALHGTASVKANDLIRQRAAKVIPIDNADTFFAGLQQKVVAQADVQRPNPRSLEMLVALAKRYLGRPEFRIQLNDLLADESRRLTSQLGESEFPLRGQGTREEYCRRVMRYEAVTEPMARMFGVMGVWGDEAAHRLASEVVGDLAHIRIEGGLSWWLDLRLYPAILLLYSYGLGALRAGRYDVLFRWLAQMINAEQHTTLPFVQRLAAWQSVTHERWRLLDGLDQTQTPLSDHLHEIMAAWTADYRLMERDHTSLFATFEVLITLAYLTWVEKETIQEAHAADAGAGNFVFSPVGRVSWSSTTRDQILSNLQQPELRGALLAAGFSSGDEGHFKLALENTRRITSRLPW